MTAKQTTAEEALECVAVCVQKTGWISEGDAATLRRVIEAARKWADLRQQGLTVAPSRDALLLARAQIDAAHALAAALDGEP
jgi:hypothetical protein